MRKKGWVEGYDFLVVPTPRQEELLSSWLTRTAFAHGTTLTRFISLFFKYDGSALSRTDIDFKFDEEMFERLAQKSGLRYEEIMRMSLRSEEGYLYICNDCLYPPKQIRKLKDKRTCNGLIFCPECLAEGQSPYWKKKWRYDFYTVCPRHGVFLTDRCDKCFSRVNFQPMNLFEGTAFCGKCGRDFRNIECKKIPKEFVYGLKAVVWFERGLRKGYFTIGGKPIYSLWIFEASTILQWLLDRKQDLVLEEFPMIDAYKSLCDDQNESNFNVEKEIYRSFFLNAMIYYLFRNWPKNFIAFANDNSLTHKHFLHVSKKKSFWYKETIDELVPMQNRVGRKITKEEVLGAIKYLKSRGEKVTQASTAKIVGCHFTIHKGFRSIYKDCRKVMDKKYLN
jgi:hypothetical protein